MRGAHGGTGGRGGHRGTEPQSQGLHPPWEGIWLSLRDTWTWDWPSLSQALKGPLRLWREDDTLGKAQ